MEYQDTEALHRPHNVERMGKGMYGDKKILALIPARGGSKGIKGKNVIQLAGKPLIAYTIEAALKSRYIDSTVITTDSLEIAEIAKQYGGRVPFMRPAELAKDRSKTIDAVLHAVEELERRKESYDTLILLQPTQPLRRTEDIDQALEAYFGNGEEALASVSMADDHPLLIRSIDEGGRLKPILHCSSTCRRQDMPNYYRVNGCIYINHIAELNDRTSFNDNKAPFIMEKEYSVDIDELADLAMAEYYMARNH